MSATRPRPDEPLDSTGAKPYIAAMNANPGVAKKTWTEADFEALPGDGFVHEVVDGGLVMSPKNSFQHERICSRIHFALESYNRQHRLGVVLGSSAGFWMFNRNCRAPDVSFIPKGRLIHLNFSPNSRRFFPGAPDLAVEVVSPSNTRAEMDERLRDFFASGTQIAWLIHPSDELVEVCRSLTERRLVGSGGELDGESLLPGFRYPVANLFREWDWD